MRHVNRTIRLRAGGVCWTVSHHAEGRAALIAADVIPAATELFQVATESKTWALVHVALGILANVTEAASRAQRRMLGFPDFVAKEF